ncbi:unnamed protein product [Adineta steineri]|uniref:Tetratricopeptide repeat protein n=1 Tax=Adineta steineri TaxID=433720 RepID=A0A819QC22_9BILA|nr:unnamed protein product [Adineta steineri]CAF4022547.1 unnamed protein product [Adineta steineri]
MLNKAFRTQNIDTLFGFRNVIRDIQHKLTQLQREQTSSHMSVYRVQLMSFDEVNRLRNSVGELVSMNSFLSTSPDRRIADFLLDSTGSDNTMAHVIFNIEVDPRVINAKPFADISSHSQFPNEKEVLFMAGCVFRLVDIGQEENRVHLIHLILASDDDHNLKELLASKKAKLGTSTNLFTLGVLLTEMGQLHSAEKYLIQHMKENSDENVSVHAADYYKELGNICFDRGEYELSLSICNKALVTGERTLQPTDPRIGHAHFGMGLAYWTMNDFERALASLNTALNIYKQSYGENHERVALSLNYIGNVYREEKRYDEALYSYQRALTIQKNVLPANHYCIGMSHYDIGLVHARIGEFSLAARCLETAIFIGSQSLPLDNRKYIKAYKKINFEEWADRQQALACNETILSILSKSHAPIHSDFIEMIKRTVEFLRSR